MNVFTVYKIEWDGELQFTYLRGCFSTYKKAKWFIEQQENPELHVWQLREIDKVEKFSEFDLIDRD